MKHPRLFDDVPAGATITELRPLPSDPNIRSVRVGGRVVAHLRAADLDGLDLDIGREWTPELAEAVQRCVRQHQARKAAMKLLSRRAMPHTVLLEKLLERGHDRDITAQVLDELANDGWIDDERFAESLVHELTNRKPAGERLLIDKLIARGIEADTAQHVVNRALEDRDPVHEAVDLARKRLRSMGAVSRPTAIRRISGVLMRRGFDEETTRAALDEIDLRPDENADIADPGS
jgi:regulatory protein